MFSNEGFELVVLNTVCLNGELVDTLIMKREVK